MSNEAEVAIQGEGIDMEEHRQRQRIMRRRAQWTFFRQWLRNPLAVAAISPSSPQLAKRMIAELPQGARRVIELGGGTGVFTEALLAHGIRPQDLLVIELNEELHQHLKLRFPYAHIACSDARELHSASEATGYCDGGPADAVISGLGLLSMSRSTQQAIVSAAFECLSPQGRLIQFTYGPSCPISREVLSALGLQARRAKMAWWNVPPATVFVITRRAHP